MHDVVPSVGQVLDGILPRNETTKSLGLLPCCDALSELGEATVLLKAESEGLGLPPQHQAVHVYGNCGQSSHLRSCDLKKSRSHVHNDPQESHVEAGSEVNSPFVGDIATSGYADKLDL